MRPGRNAFKVYVKERRRADKAIPLVLQALGREVPNVEEYDMIDVNSF
jgi:hypothetical protein